VIEAIDSAELVVIGPSNPPLSIWPMLAIPEVRAAVESHPSVTAVSPLIGGKAVKGPADRVMVSLGLPPGNEGVLKAYEGLIHRLVIDASDRAHSATLRGVDVIATDTLIGELDAAVRLAKELTH
jgi:LPPG:FO 2-phospho-L-lactate transferase